MRKNCFSAYFGSSRLDNNVMLGNILNPEVFGDKVSH